jgi:hypothetical protein
MTSIDVPLPDDLQQFLARPKCIDLGLPKVGKVQVRLPLGGTLKGIADVTKAIPDDCSLVFSLLLQLGPFLAGIECLLKVLGLIKPLIDIIKAISSLDPIKIAGALPEFIKATEPVLECVLQLAIAPPLFIRDLLCLLIKLLKCLIGQLKSIATLMTGQLLQIQLATAEGNTELLEQLKCAQDNAATSAEYAMSAMEVVTLILSLAEPVFGLAGVPSITIPTMGPVADVEGLNNTIATLELIVDAMSTVAEALPPGGPC